MRHIARVDPNQGVIVAGLRACGATVQSLAAVGKGCPDLLVGHQGRNLLMEVKPSEGKLTLKQRSLRPSQVEWHGAWEGNVVVVTTVEEAIAALVNSPTVDTGFSPMDGAA